MGQYALCAIIRSAVKIAGDWARQIGHPKLDQGEKDGKDERGLGFVCPEKGYFIPFGEKDGGATHILNHNLPFNDVDSSAFVKGGSFAPQGC